MFAIDFLLPSMRGEPSSRFLLQGGGLMPAKRWNLPTADETKPRHPEEPGPRTTWNTTLTGLFKKRIETYAINAWFRQRAREFVQGVVGAVAKGGFTCDLRRSSKTNTTQADRRGPNQNQSRMGRTQTNAWNPRPRNRNPHRVDAGSPATLLLPSGGARRHGGVWNSSGGIRATQSTVPFRLATCSYTVGCIVRLVDSVCTLIANKSSCAVSQRPGNRMDVCVYGVGGWGGGEE